MLCISKSLYDLCKYLGLHLNFSTAWTCCVKEKWPKKSLFPNCWLYVMIFDSRPKNGGLYLRPWNPYRWLSPQRTHKVEYVSIFLLSKLRAYAVNSQSLTFQSDYIQKVHFSCCLLTQIATWQPNQTILTSSVKAILKAMINKVVLEPSLGVVRIFYSWWEVFSTRESTLRLTAHTSSFVIMSYSEMLTFRCLLP